MRSFKKILRNLSTSNIYTKRLKNRTSLSGGVTVDRSVAIDRIRQSSIGLGRDILKSENKNLVQYSEEFDNVYWVKNGSTVSVNITNSPISTLTADKLIESATTSTHNFRTGLFDFVSGTSYFYSIYAKKGERKYIHIAGTNVLVFGYTVDLDTGTLFYTAPGGASSTINIIDSGNGWYRIVISKIPSSSGSGAVRTGLADGVTIPAGGDTPSYLGDGASGLYLWGAQFEIATTATNYQPTQATPIRQGASFVWTPSSYGEDKNYSVYPQLNNVLKFSQDYSNAVWNINGLTQSTNTNLNPFGENRSSYITETGTTSAHYIQYNGGFTNAIAGNYYTSTYYVKKVDCTWVQFGTFGIAFGTNVVNFNFDTGTFGTLVGSMTYSAVLISNGYYKIITTCLCTLSGGTAVLSAILGSNNTNTTGVAFTYAGVNGRNLCEVAGIQTEIGSTATPYQRTTDGIIDLNFTRATTATVTNKDGSNGDSCYNLLQRSEEFGNAIWIINTVGGANLSVTSDNSISPVGTLTADKLTATGGVNDFIYQQTTLANGNIVSGSLYFKNIDSITSKLQLRNTVTSLDLFLNWSGAILNSITLSTGTTSSFVDVGNGWYRVIYTTTTNEANQNFRIFPDANLTGKSVNVWGAQLVQGQPRDYLKTTNRLAVPRIDYTPIRKNSLNYSEEFDNAIWLKTASTITANVVTDPLGGVNADKLVEIVANNNHYIEQQLASTQIPVTLSVYAKAGERSWLLLDVNNNVSVTTILFDLTNGVKGGATTSGVNYSNISSNITSVGGGWYLCSLTYTSSGSFTNRNIIGVQNANNLNTYLGDGTSGVYIYGAQVEVGSVATYYQKTTTIVIPRTEDYGKPSLLIEPQRTNLALRSEDFANASWIKNAATITPNTVNSPGGVLTGSTITTTNTVGYITQSITGTISSTVYTASVYVKQGGTSLRVSVTDNTIGSMDISINTLTGIFSTTSAASWSNVSGNVILINGWYRVSISGTKLNTAVNCNMTIDNAGAISTNYIWGSQLEIGSNATTYIPTTTATVTRNAESSFVDLWNNNLLNKDNFTLYAEGYLYNGVTSNPVFGLGDVAATGGSNFVGFYGGINPILRDGTNTTNSGNNLPNNTYYKFAVQRNGSSIKFFRNGTQVWTTQTIPVFDYRYLLVSNGDITYAVNKIELYKETLSDAQCIAKTT